MSALATLLLPFRRYADFRGRSRRTEVMGFYLVAMLANVALTESEPLTGEAFGWLNLGVWLVLLCPTFALIVRRLHDTGRGGWWAVILVPIAAMNLWDDYVRILSPYAPSIDQALPIPVTLTLMAGFLVLIVLLLWEGERGANRYGPDPRQGGTTEAPDLS